jgi:uncharacterized membrane protein
VKLLAFLTDAFLIVLSLFGIVFALRGSLNIGTGRFITVAIFVLILYLAFIPGIVGYTRFKIPIMPYISIFAALGMGGIRKDI